MYSESGFSFTLFDSEQNKFIGFFNFPFEKNTEETPSQQLSTLLGDFNWLAFSFSEVNFIVSNSYSTLVPLPLFDQAKADTYLQFNQNKPENSEVDFDILKNNVAANVYYLPDSLKSALSGIWPNVKIIHSASALLEILAINYKNLSDDNQVFIHVGGNRFELVYFKKNKLHFYNSFKYKTKEDFMYFILAAFEQLSVNPEEVKLTLLGTIDKSGKLYEIVYSYIRKIHFIDQNENFSYSYVLDELQPHFYYVLFNVLQCG